MTVSSPVQKTGQLNSNNGTVGQGGSATWTSSQWAASTARSTLVAVVSSRAGSTAFTKIAAAGAGWTMKRSAANGTAIRTEVWVWENNPGGVTFDKIGFTSGTGPVNGEISEWLDPAGVVTFDTSGIASPAAANTCPVTAGAANEAHSLQIVGFACSFSATQSGSWTTPANNTILATQAGTTLAAAFYYRTDLPQGTASATGTFSNGSTSQGWAAVIATFKTAVTASPTGTPGLVGDNLSSTIWSSQTNAIAAWNTMMTSGGVTRTVGVRRYYIQAGKIPAAITADLKELTDNGIKAKLSVKVATDGSDADALRTFLSSCKAYGLAADLIFWHEPYQEGLSVATYQAMIKVYAPVANSAGYGVVFNGQAGSGALTPALFASYFSGIESYFSGAGVDYYCTGYINGIRLDGYTAVTDPYGLPFDLNEFGASDLDQTDAQITAYYSYLQTWQTSRIAAGKVAGDMCHFAIAIPAGQPFDTPLVNPSAQLTAFRSLYDAVTVGGGGTVAVSVSTAALPQAETGAVYPPPGTSASLKAANGTSPYTWALNVGSSPLPAGLSLSSGGSISGTCTAAAGNYPFTVKVTDSTTPTAGTATKTLSITVIAGPSLPAVALPTAKLLSPYTAQVTATGGTGPFRYALATGDNVPAGLTFGGDGSITGTPNGTEGTTSFGVVATDSLGVTATATYSITVTSQGSAGGGGAIPPVFSPRNDWHFYAGPKGGGYDHELAQATNRTVTWMLTDAHTAGFTVNAGAGYDNGITELATDLHIRRGGDLLYRGRIGASSDDFTNGHFAGFQASSYRALLDKRILYSSDMSAGSSTLTWTNKDIGDIVWALIAITQGKSGGNLGLVKGNGFPFGLAGSKTVSPGDFIAEKIDDLAYVDSNYTPAQGGFDWDITPVDESSQTVDLWAGGRGNDRGVILQRGDDLTGIAWQRSFDPSDFASAGRMTGGNDIAAEYAATGIGSAAEGRWEGVYSTDETDPDRLLARLILQIEAVGNVVPSWVIPLRPGAWGGPGHIWLGDPVQVRPSSGRLTGIDRLRVLEIAATITQDGEQVTVTTGSPSLDLARMFKRILRELRHARKQRAAGRQPRQ